jgi:hypothetical protein
LQLYCSQAVLFSTFRRFRRKKNSHMPLLSLNKTATFAWSPTYDSQQSLYLATGSVSGALDASFSTHSQLELVRLQFGNTLESSVAASFALPARYSVITA